MTFKVPNYPIDGVVYPNQADSEFYQRVGAWHTLTAGNALRAAATRAPNKCALVCEGNRISYAEFDDASERLGAALLHLGLRPSDRVLFQMGSVIETAIALLACAKAGLVPVCTLPQHRAIEISSLATRAEARAYIAQADFSSFNLVGFASEMAEANGIPHLIVARSRGDKGNFLSFEQLINSVTRDQARETLASVDVSIADVLMFQLSGGTTSVPKIIPRCHGEFLGVARNKTIRSSMDENLVGLYALPLIHTAGMISMLYPCILMTGTLVLMQRMDAKTFFTLIERERVTHSVSIGPSANQMLEYDGIQNHDRSSLRLLTNFDGSEAMERHVGVPCMNVYGIGEGLLTSSEINSSRELRFDTVGWPLSPYDEIRLVEPGTDREVEVGELGELCFRGPSMIRGYYKMPEVNAASYTADGFFRTGDVLMRQYYGGQVAYSFRGRMRDNINRGGEKFGAEEVETIIGRHPDVLDVKVVAMPDRAYGEKACAFVILVPGTRVPTVSELGAFLINEGLAKYKLPERIETIESFPVTRVGKIDKQALRTLIANKLAQEEAEKSAPALRAQS